MQAIRITSSRPTAAQPSGPQLIPGPRIGTGVGARLEIAVIRDFQARYYQGGRYIDPLSLRISYADPYRYFRGAKSINAYVAIHTYRQYKSGAKTPAHDYELRQVPLALKDGKYQADLPLELEGGVGDNFEVLDYADLAFDLGDRWDSNEGANYRVTIRHRQ